MDKKIASKIIFSLMIGVLLTSSEGCSEYIGPEDEINEGWENYADTLNTSDLGVCDPGFTNYEGSFMEVQFSDVYGFHKAHLVQSNGVLLDDFGNLFLQEGDIAYLAEFIEGGNSKFDVYNCEGFVVYDQLSANDLEDLFENGYTELNVFDNL